MKLHRYLTGLFLAGALLGPPVGALADENRGGAMDAESAFEGATAEVLSYCYAGSLLDESTGEVIDLYTFCVEEGMQDIA